MKPIFSALGLVAAGSIMYLVKTFISDNQSIVQKQVVKQILITLRKRFFSSLRQIAYVINSIKTIENDFQPKKISQVIMKDGGSGDAKLNMIQELTIKSYNITSKAYFIAIGQEFQASCNFYKNEDYEIRILLKNLHMDIELALNGTIETYNGPTVFISSQRVIHIYRQILKRRMQNIKEKIVNKANNQQCIKRQVMIEDYLEIEGIKSEKEPNQKVFIAILEKKYREDADFRIQFEHLEVEMSDFMKDIEKEQEIVLKQSIKKQLPNSEDAQNNEKEDI